MKVRHNAHWHQFLIPLPRIHLFHGRGAPLFHIEQVFLPASPRVPETDLLFFSFLRLSPFFRDARLLQKLA
jgi:hypothetical protein